MCTADRHDDRDPFAGAGEEIARPIVCIRLACRIGGSLVSGGAVQRGIGAAHHDPA